MLAAPLVPAQFAKAASPVVKITKGYAKVIPAEPLDPMEKYWRRDGGIVKFHITPDCVGVDGRIMRMTYGTIEVDAEAVAQGRTADFYRKRVIPPLHQGHKREAQEFHLSNDGQCLSFHFVDSSWGDVMQSRLEHEMAIHDAVMAIREHMIKEMTVLPHGI